MLEGATVTPTTISFELKDVAPWIAIVISLLTLAYVIRRDKASDSNKRISTIEGKLETKAGKGTVDVLLNKVDVAESDITRIKEELKHLPDKDATHRLELALGEVRGELRGLTEKIKPIAAVADRIQDAALERIVP